LVSVVILSGAIPQRGRAQSKDPYLTRELQAEKISSVILNAALRVPSFLPAPLAFPASLSLASVLEAGLHGW